MWSEVENMCAPKSSLFGNRRGHPNPNARKFAMPQSLHFHYIPLMRSSPISLSLFLLHSIHFSPSKRPSPPSPPNSVPTWTLS